MSDLPSSTPTGRTRTARSSRASGPLAAALVVGLFATIADGFGDRGHRIVAQIALSELSAEAKATLTELLDGRTLQDVASEPDRWRRDHPETAPWHYVNLPADAAGYDPERDETAHGDVPFAGNVVERIAHFRAALSDPQTSKEDAATAVIWLTHLVGDIHQPLHVGLSEDRGGNDIRLFLDSGEDVGGANDAAREATRLHWIWDGTLLDRREISWERHAAELEADITDRERVGWKTGCEITWANESWALANSVAYRDANGRWLKDGDHVGRRYLLTRTVAVEEQLRKAGVRLGALLERALAARRCCKSTAESAGAQG